MLPNGVLGTGISAPYPKGDLSDFAAILDRVEALGVETIELPPSRPTSSSAGASTARIWRR